MVIAAVLLVARAPTKVMAAGPPVTAPQITGLTLDITPGLVRLPPDPPRPSYLQPDAAFLAAERQARQQGLPIHYRLVTKRPVIFVGIDDGVFKTKAAADWLIYHQLPFSLFLYNDTIKSDYGYFKALQTAGMTVEDHTVSHAYLPKLKLKRQRQEICRAANTYQAIFGHRPTLFRPPYGAFNDTTLAAVADCGLHDVVLWHAMVEHGRVFFQQGRHFLPGDIVLMHFHEDFTRDIKAFMRQARHDHLQVARLEDWLK